MKRMTACLALIAFVAITKSSIGARYTVQGLGDLPGGDIRSSATAINNLGQVVGTSNVAGGFHAFIWDSGAMTDLGNLPGGETTNSWVYGINDSGQAVGYSDSANGYRAFRWEAGVLVDLGSISGTGNHSLGFGINAQGTVVGLASGTRGERGFAWDPINQMRELSGLQAAKAINDLGDIAGYAPTQSSPANAAIWSDAQVSILPPLPGMYVSRANAINNLGCVAGLSQGLIGSPLATLWCDGNVTNLGYLSEREHGSEAFGMNDFGQVVGRSIGDVGPTFGVANAFLWEDGPMKNLNYLIDANSNWGLWEAWDINNAGQIVGMGRSPSGHEEAFLLTPVPEPASWTLALGAIAGIAVRKCLRRPRCDVG